MKTRALLPHETDMREWVSR